MPAPPPRPSARRFAALLTVLALAACAGFLPQPGPDPEPAQPAAWRALTTPIVAIGDTQEHESTGVPLHDNDNANDAFVEVTQRPPEQPLFGRRVMEWVLQAHPGEPFLHLGDVMDLSCRAEAERVTRVFEAAGSPGAIVPGNHDGLMFGVYGYNPIAAAADPVPAERVVTFRADGLLQMGGRGWRVIHTPGHSVGHVVFFRRSDGVAIAGDVVRNASLRGGMGRLSETPWAFSEDPLINRPSMRRLWELQPSLLCLGHGPPSRDLEGLRRLVNSLT